MLKSLSIMNPFAFKSLSIDERTYIYIQDTILPVEKRRKLSSNASSVSTDQADEDLSDSDINGLVGSTESYDLQVWDAYAHTHTHK